MDVTNSTAAAAAATASPSPSAAGGNAAVLSSDFETFLQMLTAQARYQDPLEPIDSSEYAAQLAQFSSVEQQVQTNELLTSMMTQFSTSNMAQVAGWIGMEARTDAPTYFDGGAVTLAPVPAPAAEELRLIVIDAAGEEVQTRLLPASNELYQWDGLGNDGNPLPNGNYSFKLESIAQDEVIDTSAVEAYTRISEARNEDGQTMLILQSGAPVDAARISALRQPEPV